MFDFLHDVYVCVLILVCGFVLGKIVWVGVGSIMTGYFIGRRVLERA